MKKSFLASWLLLLVFCLQAQDVKVSYVDAIENSNHPQVAYWFITSDQHKPAVYKAKIDSFAKFSKYTLVFLTEREGYSFYDSTNMHPIFKDMVAYAHQKGLKLGLQIWKRDFFTSLENTDRLIQEGEQTLDANGEANYQVQAFGAREMNSLIKSELFKVFAFKKTADGFYQAGTLLDISSKAIAVNAKETVSVKIKAGENLKGYQAYILTQHYYNSCSNFSDQAMVMLLNAFKAYRDIPFDGIGLDEYKNLKIARQKIMDSTGDVFRERLYSVGMAKKMKSTTGKSMEQVLLEMRYAPVGKPEIRISAINQYMQLLRSATLPLEAAVYDLGKKMYGSNNFIGLHNTFHNNLDKDEVWQTGVSWWSIKRDYGHTDEETPTPIQIGVGMSYKKNAMYNMYYGPKIDRIWTKALYDLRFGIRTHYHAANDMQGWGVSIDAPYALAKINPVENAARLLNKFNPPFPAIKLLVVYGMEAIYNWYPNLKNRGMYDINDKLGMERKSLELWNNGYYHAAVPTDLIEDGRLKLNAKGKPILNGYEFDAIVFLNPQYAKKSTTQFFQTYVKTGGKLLLEGSADKGFMGEDISAIWTGIASKAIANKYSLSNVAKLGILPNQLKDGVTNGSGIFTFTNQQSLETNQSAFFEFDYAGNHFKGTYKGLAVIAVDPKGNLIKIGATGFSYLSRNGTAIFSLSKESDLFMETKDGNQVVQIADPTKTIQIVQTGMKK